jgi:hypothetical protein
VRVTDSLADTISLDSVETTRGTCTYRALERDVECQLGKLKTGKPVTIKIVALAARQSGAVRNTAMVEAATIDPNRANNASTLDVLIR